MASFTDLHPCPHCGNEMHNGAMARHEPMCFKNPAVFALCRSALASLSDRNRGITLTHYKALRTIDSTLPARATLQNMTGCGPWNDVLAAFGLLPPDEKEPCPHCGKEYLYSAIADHVATCKAARPKVPAVTKVTAPPPLPRKERKPINIFVSRKPAPVKPPAACPVCNMQPIDPRRHQCPEDPAILAWLAATLPDPADPDRIITVAEYKALPKRAISAVTLTRYYGSWPALAARFGLTCRAPRTGAPELTATVRAVLHRLAAELHNGAHGPSISEYQVYAGEPVRKAHVLRDAFGSWNAVLAAAGLQPGTRSQYYLAAHERRKAHFAAHGAPAPVASRYERGDEAVPREQQGLFVGDDDPRKPNYKPPIIHTDRVPPGYVRVMIR